MAKYYKHNESGMIYRTADDWPHDKTANYVSLPFRRRALFSDEYIEKGFTKLKGIEKKAAELMEKGWIYRLIPDGSGWFMDIVGLDDCFAVGMDIADVINSMPFMMHEYFKVNLEKDRD